MAWKSKQFCVLDIISEEPMGVKDKPKKPRGPKMANAAGPKKVTKKKAKKF